MRPVSLQSRLFTALFFLLLGHNVFAQLRVFQGRVLFSDTSVLNIDIFIPLDSIRLDDCRNPRYFKAKVILSGHEIKAEVRKRAKFRCDPANCSLPSLMIKTDPGDASGTVFQGCKKLKITHPCRPEKKGFQSLIFKEYLIYKLFNQLTDTSFRVRPALFTYRNFSSGEALYRVFGFFIEDDDDLARRIDAKVLNATNISDDLFDPGMLALTSVFEYMIGNTDYSTETAHNIAILAPGAHLPLLPVPYDFDWSGLVNAPYARPALHTGLTQVTQRWYQGPCPHDSVLNQVRINLWSKKNALLNEIDAFDRLNKREKRQMHDYIEKFYRELSDPARFGKMLRKTCRKPAIHAK